MKKQNGFTLVEILASVVVLIAIGSIVAGILASSLRGANKTNTVENIRQNGNYALAQMSKDIEYAQVFNGVSDTGETYVQSCYAVPPASPPSAKFIKVTPPGKNPIIYHCDGSILTVAAVQANGEISSPTWLTDTNSLALTSCTISCTQNKITDVPIIGLSFVLSSGSSSSLVENIGSISFNTSVTPRNYLK